MSHMAIGLLIGAFLFTPFGFFIGAVLTMEHYKEIIDEYERRSRVDREIVGSGDETEQGVAGYDLRRGSHVREQ